MRAAVLRDGRMVLREDVAGPDTDSPAAGTIVTSVPALLTATALSRW